jgi:Fe-S-cluster containining protein
VNELNLKQFIPSEFCIRCFGCCRFKEKENIWAPLGIKLIPSLQEGGFICPNLDLKTNLCRIYSERPFDCQLYPFLLNRKKDKVFLSVHLHCPFIEKNLERESFKRYVRYLKGYLSKIKIEPKFILEYPKDEIIDLEGL